MNDTTKYDLRKIALDYMVKHEVSDIYQFQVDQIIVIKLPSIYYPDPISSRNEYADIARMDELDKIAKETQKYLRRRRMLQIFGRGPPWPNKPVVKDGY